MSSFKRTFGFIHRHPLAKRHLFKAYFNIFSWQIRSCFSKELISSRFIHDIKIFTKKGMTGVTGNLYAGLHEFNEMGFLLHFITESDVFIDVGANAGSYTLLAAGVKKAHCVSFEPSPSAFHVLEKNIQLNQLETLVKTVNAAVGNEDKILNFSLNQDTTNHVVNEGEELETIPVKVVKLDNLVPEEQPTLLKIDVEGFETAVIQGASKIIANKKLKAIIIELIGSGQHYGFDEEKIHQQLLSSGFLPYVYDPFKRELSALKHFGGDNTLYIRDLDFVMDRINKAPSFRVFGESI